MILLNPLPAPYPGAEKLYFFLTDSSTPTPSYQDADGEDEHTNPVLADSEGLFPAIYVDPAVAYRIVMTAVGGDLTAPLWEVDPYTPPGQGVASFNTRSGAVTLNADDIEDALGYVPATDEAASESAPGQVQLASDAEIAAGISAVKAITPAGLFSLTPSNTDRALIRTATTAEIKTGTEDEAAISPAGLRSLRFESSELTITASTPAAVAHGLGQVPTLVVGALRCKSAENGFAVGDEVPLTNYNDASIGLSMYANGTNVGYHPGSSLAVINGAGSNATADLTKWKLVIRAYVL